ncbi:hypothetical protein NQ317_017404 [Molorchus minor]|uniref:Nose resistant-to-fluoxetine protein N-terminal domain-containing protein n=1 Tax=Molorchus minor TaxID=1323400 RepID=A0ABQ9JJ71_9CUCU|nr:hypothetical protein NQ317_017404 [Molorchus minor]
MIMQTGEMETNRKDVKRKSVKLTMKQGLLMNQILSVYALENAQNEACRNHTKEFKNDLRTLEPWALKMFDSSSKLQAGILLGNMMDFGSFSQCLQIYKNTEFGPIYGKHCLLKIKPSIQLIRTILKFRNITDKRFEKVYTTVETSELAWSVCVPHTCPREDILRHFNKSISDMAEGLEITVGLDNHYCNTIVNQPVMGLKQYIVLNLKKNYENRSEKGVTFFAWAEVINQLEELDCIYPIWYLSNDIIFYFLSPVILYPLWKWPTFGYLNTSLLFVLATAASFYYAWINKYNGEILPITNQLLTTKYFTDYYLVPHLRAAPYILGLAFGYVIFQTRNRKIKINKWFNISMWSISLAVMLATVIGSRNFYLENHEYNRLEATCYLVFSRPAWTLGVMWIMWSCMHGYGGNVRKNLGLMYLNRNIHKIRWIEGIVNEVMSASVFQVLGRITYAIFLIHSPVQLYKNGSAKAPLTFSNVNVVRRNPTSNNPKDSGQVNEDTKKLNLLFRSIYFEIFALDDFKLLFEIMEALRHA